MSTFTTLCELPLLPRDADGPTFAQPWHAQAFAVVVELIESERLTRQEWAEQLGQTLREAENSSAANTGEHYYDHWLDALEKVVIAKNFADSNDLRQESQTIRDNDHHRREDQLHRHP